MSSPESVARTEMPFLAHQFETPAQQLEAGKLGMWLFILTELLFFSGLFCAYAIYRTARAEVFLYAHFFLDLKLGLLNTSVLLVSSLTAALAVRAAQLGARRKLVAAIIATIACGMVFVAIKTIEYTAKVHEGLLPGARFNPAEDVWKRDSFARRYPEAARYAEMLRARAGDSPSGPAPRALPSSQGVPAEAVEPLLRAGVIGRAAEFSTLPSQPKNAHVFFGIYFLMTGLHALHVIVGLGVWCWLLVRAVSGHFGPSYFGPIDYGALYWHLVDLLWIYLFPLLYLVH